MVDRSSSVRQTLKMVLKVAIVTILKDLGTQSLDENLDFVHVGNL